MKNINKVLYIDTDYGCLCAIGSIGIKPTVLYNPTRIKLEYKGTVKFANVGDCIEIYEDDNIIIT